MDIAVLGPGCRNCNALEQSVHEALDQLGIDQDVEKITDIREIASYGVISTPALAIDGQVAIAGRVPPVSELTRILGAARP